MDNTISARDIRNQFADILNQVVYAGRTFIISRFDKPVAKIVPIKSADEDDEIKRKKKAVERIRKLRKLYKGVDLTKIVIRERDKEYRRWTK